MEIKNKLVAVLALSTMLMVGCSSVASSNSNLVEGAYDNFNRAPTVQVRQQAYIGGDETVAYSDIYAQYGKDNENNYWVRFAIAVKGEVSTLSYSRAAVSDLEETEPVEKEVTTVYQSVMSNGVATYYNAISGLSVNESDKGNYYWACYSIKLENEKYYSTPITMSFKVDGKVVKDRTTSLNTLLGTGNENENTYRFEAEAAKVSGNSSAVQTDYGHACFVKSYYYLEACSNNYCLRNIYLQEHQFDFNADVADEAYLKIYLANSKSQALSNIISIKVNDSQLDLTGITVEKGTPLVAGNEYFNFIEVSVPVSLKADNNSIVLSKGAEAYANIDYIEVVTSAQLSGWEDNYWLKNPGSNQVTITTVPTMDSAGQFEVGCTNKTHGTILFDLPALSDEEFYTYTEKDNLKTYSFDFFGGTFVAYQEEIIKTKHNLTIQNGTYNGSSTAQIESGATLDSEKVVANIPSDFELYGWYNVDTNKEIDLSAFVMPMDDITIAPIFKPATFVNSGNGWLDYGECTASSTSGYIDNSSNVSITNGKANSDRVTGFIGDGKYGTIIEFSTTKANSSFRTKTYYNREANVSYKQTYYIVNLGFESISFTMNQVNTSTTKEGHQKEVTLGVGESISFDLTYSFSNTNNNLMSYFEFNSIYSNAILGINSYVSQLNN